VILGVRFGGFHQGLLKLVRVVAACETQPMGQLGQAEFAVTVAVSYYRVLLYALKFNPIPEMEPELN
jgi:hypothetical protein